VTNVHHRIYTGRFGQKVIEENCRSQLAQGMSAEADPSAEYSVPKWASVLLGRE